MYEEGWVEVEDCIDTPIASWYSCLQARIHYGDDGTEWEVCWRSESGTYAGSAAASVLIDTPEPTGETGRSQ